MNQNQPLHIERECLSYIQIKIAYVGDQLNPRELTQFAPTYLLQKIASLKSLNEEIISCPFLQLPDVLVLEIEQSDECFNFIRKVKASPVLRGILIILLSKFDRADWKIKARELKVQDFYVYPFNVEDLKERINFLLKMRIINPEPSNSITINTSDEVSIKMPYTKRIFDILLSAAALLVLFPLFLIIAIMIRLESKGPVIYKSKRVGMGYKLFSIYKFRSMNVNADLELCRLSDFNQYKIANSQSKSVFVKIANDPRVTRVGRFLRRTSLDELPQLYNIFLGDMSFVGNRPLSENEAQMLTCNEWSARFSGPAGLTGLWQVMKRGKKNMCEKERKELDNAYVRNYSFWTDIKILLKTIPAILQEENV